MNLDNIVVDKASQGSNPQRLPIDANFNIDLANDLARLESFNKHLYRPNTYLHKWWARRCGTTFRLLLKHLVTDKDREDYYTDGGLEGKVILDPMIGGGTILHEAIRLGANVVGLDIDPIPIIQARVSLTDVPISKIEQAFNGFLTSLKAELDTAYLTHCRICSLPTSQRFTLYGLKTYCHCGPRIIVDSLELRTESTGKAITICPICHGIRSDNEPCMCPLIKEKKPILEKANRRCPDCGQVLYPDFSVPYYRRYEPLVIVGSCDSHGLFFAEISKQELALIEAANDERERLLFNQPLNIQPGPKSIDLVRRNIGFYSDLFSSRQLQYINQVIKHLANVELAFRDCFALLVSTSLEFNSMLCGYKGASRRRAGAVRHAFSHHAYSFPYTALENNPVYAQPSSGTLQRLFVDRVVKARKWANKPRERSLSPNNPKFVVIENEVDHGEEIQDAAELKDGTHKFLLKQASSRQIDLPDESVDYIVTDPPYYDNVQYHDLATFFHVWLRQMLTDSTYPEINWDYSPEEAAVFQSSTSANHPNGEGYIRLLGEIFSECHRVLRKQNGRLIFSYHHWNPSSWAALTLALKRAKFVLINRYVVHSENPISVHINKLQALTDDAILVLAPEETNLSRQWPKPKKVNMINSAKFIGDCAAILGWMLMMQNQLTREDIPTLWKELIEL